MTTVAQPPRQSLSEGGYEIEIAVQGYPGKAVCHGGLGWSTIALLRGHGRVALIDTGSWSAPIDPGPPYRKRTCAN